jgi:SAM-dependent methyltransferase
VSNRQSFDRFAADYDRFAGLEPPLVLRWLLTQLPAHGGRVLDAGCGAGRHTQVLAEHFDEVLGVDISEPLIDIARQHSAPNVRYVVGDLRSFRDAMGFDLVFSSTTLHHVPDLEASLLHLRGLVRPGGIAILVDNVASRPTPPRWIHVLGAVRDFPSDVARLGWRQARWLLKFRTSAAWLDHLASDRYLSRQAFERRYGSIFPGARFQNLGYAHALVWAKKNPAAVTRGDEVRREPWETMPGRTVSDITATTQNPSEPYPVRATGGS